MLCLHTFFQRIKKGNTSNSHCDISITLTLKHDKDIIGKNYIPLSSVNIGSQFLNIILINRIQQYRNSIIPQTK